MEKWWLMREKWKSVEGVRKEGWNMLEMGISLICLISASHLAGQYGLAWAIFIIQKPYFFNLSKYQIFLLIGRHKASPSYLRWQRSLGISSQFQIPYCFADAPTRWETVFAFNLAQLPFISLSYWFQFQWRQSQDCVSFKHTFSQSSLKAWAPMSISSIPFHNHP